MAEEWLTPPAPVTARGHAAAASDGVQLCYELLQLGRPAAAGGDGAKAVPSHRVLMIMGFAAASPAWYPLLVHLQRHALASGQSYAVLLMDNRGIGHSSSPPDKRAYTTSVMAEDAMAVMDAVGWRQGSPPAHVVGFSMGAMIATKLAALCAMSGRVASLCAMSVTGGGLQVLPHSLRAWKYSLSSMGTSTPEERAKWDLKFHFSRSTLHALVTGPDGRSRSCREVLLAEYVAVARAGAPQPKAGFSGQAHACWTHRVTEEDVRSIRQAGRPVCFIHGRHDIVATPKFGEQQAKRLAAPFMLLDAGHFVPREQAQEVCAILAAHISQQPMKLADLLVLGPDLATQAGAGAAEAGAAAAGAAGHAGSPLSRSDAKEQELLLLPQPYLAHEHIAVAAT